MRAFKWQVLLRVWGVSVAVAAGLSAQSAGDTAEAHVALARAAGAKDHPGLLEQLCSPAALRPPTGTRAGEPPPRGANPDRSTWHVEPVKVFDNLYFFGEKEFSVWAVTTSAGIIVIDSIFDYSVEDEVVEGMKKMGLDPKTIKYVIVSHGHFDHSGGARLLQQRYDSRVILSAADWDLSQLLVVVPARRAGRRSRPCSRCC